MRKYTEYVEQIENWVNNHHISLITAIYIIKRKYHLNQNELNFLHRTLILYGWMEG